MAVDALTIEERDEHPYGPFGDELARNGEPRMADCVDAASRTTAGHKMSRASRNPGSFLV